MNEMTGAPPSAGLAPRRADADYLRGVTFVLLAATFWSLSGILVRLTEGAGAWQIILYRSGSLVPTLALVIALRYRGEIVTAFRAAGRNGLVAGAFQAGASIAFILALQHTTVANALFMLGGAPFFGALLGWWMIGERVRRTTWVAMALAFVGVAVMVANGFALGTAAGNLLALTSSVCFAVFSVLLRRGRATDMMPCACYAGVIATLVAAAFIVLSAPVGGGLGGAAAGFVVGQRDLALCVAMGVGQLGLGLTCYMTGARYVPAAELMLLATLELILGPLWVWLGVGEVPSALTLAGGGIIMAAIGYQALSGARRGGAAAAPG